MAVNQLHEQKEDLTNDVLDAHRAYKSLMEEIEAVDWYQQRAEATNDEQLKEILYHNMKEEMEHACMMLEWIRRKQDGWDEKMRTYLFKQDEVTKLEKNDNTNLSHKQNLKIGKVKIRKNKHGYLKTEISSNNQ